MKMLYAVPVEEDTLEETINVLKYGLHHAPSVSDKTREFLGTWCDDHEDEIHTTEHPDQPEDDMPVFNTAGIVTPPDQEIEAEEPEVIGNV